MRLDVVAQSLLDEFFRTRLLELGQPKSAGLLRRRSIIEGPAFHQAFGDTVRLALALAATDREQAIELARSDYGLDDDADLDAWLRTAEERAERRIQGLKEVSPIWLRFVSIAATPPGGGEVQVIGWVPEELDLATADSALDHARGAYTSALGWALRRPLRGREAFARGTVSGEEDDELEFHAFATMSQRVLEIYRGAS